VLFLFNSYAQSRLLLANSFVYIKLGTASAVEQSQLNAAIHMVRIMTFKHTKTTISKLRNCIITVSSS